MSCTQTSRESLSCACLKLQRSGKFSIHTTTRLMNNFSLPGQHPRSSLTMYLLITVPFASSDYIQVPIPILQHLLSSSPAVFLPCNSKPTLCPSTKSHEVLAAGFSAPVCYAKDLHFLSQSKLAVICSCFLSNNWNFLRALCNGRVCSTTSERSTSSLATPAQSHEGHPRLGKPKDTKPGGDKPVSKWP